MPTPDSRRADGERGTAVIEFALILPLLMCIILGMFTGGVLANRQIEITHAAREGARYGSMVPVSDSFLSGTWATNVRDVVVALPTTNSRPTRSASPSSTVTFRSPSPTPTPPRLTTRPASTTPAITRPGAGSRCQAATTGRLEAFFFTRTVDLAATVTSRYEDLG